LNLQERAITKPEYLIDSEEIRFQQDVESFALDARTKIWNLCSAACVSRSKSESKQVVRQNPGIMHSKDSYSVEDLHQLRLDTGPAPPSLPEGIAVQDRQIPVRDGSTIAIRIYSPTKPGASRSPLVVNYHGGGFFMGNLETEVEMY
jgi:acetyl esterase/lipase